PSATAGQGFDVTVTAEGPSDATIANYGDTVHFISSDPQVAAGDGLPADYAFVPSDHGSHTFHNVILRTAGTQSITVGDSILTTVMQTANVEVEAAAATTIHLVSGDGQTASVADAFLDPIEVAVSDAFGNAVEGASVAFAAPVAGA